jgi:hypothetical protein
MIGREKDSVCVWGGGGSTMEFRWRSWRLTDEDAAAVVHTVLVVLMQSCYLTVAA